MTASLRLLLALLISKAHGYTCPQSQTVDTHHICHIFANTNIDNIIEFQGRNFSDNNYCTWEMFWGDHIIGCDNSTSEIIKKVIISGLHGTLDFTYSWPSHLIELDIEQYSWPYDTTLIGQFNWETLRPLNQLEELDLEDNLFSGKLTNDIWNMIASLPSLKSFTLEGNKFDMDFSEINIDTPSQTIKEIEISDNYNFYGTMNVSSFFSSFPKLRVLELEWHNIYGYFPNLDVLDNLRILRLDHNHFSGRLIFSDGYAFHENLLIFAIDYNQFDGDIDWSIFAHLYNLQSIDINNNYFTGTIGWNVVSDLVNNGSLEYIDLDYNNFEGFADFTWINATITLYVDTNVHCDPEIYPCPGGISADRTTTYCYSKASCEATCQCIPTPQPTTSPTENTQSPTPSPTYDDAPVNMHTTQQLNENESVPANDNANEMVISMSTFIVFLLMIMCCSCVCVIIGIIIGCYSFKIVSMKQNISESNINHPPNINKANDMNVFPTLPTELINEGGLPKLPQEQYSDDINYNTEVKQENNNESDEQKQTEFEVVETDKGIDNGENSPLTPIDDNNISFQNIRNDKEGNAKNLKNYKSESNSEALYVIQSPKSTKGKNKLAFADNVSLMSVQVIHEDNENI